MLGAEVQPDRTARLVKQLKAYWEENRILQKTLASQLWLSPQGISPAKSASTFPNLTPKTKLAGSGADSSTS
jgi:hypothetical protein